MEYNEETTRQIAGMIKMIDAYGRLKEAGAIYLLCQKYCPNSKDDKKALKELRESFRRYKHFRLPKMVEEHLNLDFRSLENMLE